MAFCTRESSGSHAHGSLGSLGAFCRGMMLWCALFGCHVCFLGWETIWGSSCLCHQWSPQCSAALRRMSTVMRAELLNLAIWAESHPKWCSPCSNKGRSRKWKFSTGSSRDCSSATLSDSCCSMYLDYMGLYVGTGSHCKGHCISKIKK